MVLIASLLMVFSEHAELLEQTEEPRQIATVLGSVGVRFEQWALKEDYSAEIEQLKQEEGFQLVDIVKMTQDHPQKESLREKFLSEHVHDEPEVRFFSEGSGLFYLHIENKVYVVRCEAGDLISVPELCRHWFDMGETPSFTAIRFFTRPDGWIARFTDDKISQNF